MKTKISETGYGLTVRINCSELSKVYDWLTFATWYTCCRSLPDAKFCVSIPKPEPGNREILFNWLDRCKIRKIAVETPLTEPTLVLKPQALQLRGFYSEELNEINSEVNLMSENCELFRNSKSVKKVDWLSARTLSENSVFLITDEVIGSVDVRSWAARSREPIFTAVWTDKTAEEKFIQPLWHKIGMYYAMVTR